MTRNDMITLVAQRCGVTRARATQAVDDLFDEAAGELRAGGTVQLPGIGTLSRIPTAGGVGRNPRTGEPIEIAAGWRVKFSQGAPMKRRLAELAPPQSPARAAE